MDEKMGAGQLQPQWDGKLTITLGPKFQSGTPFNVIAADFYTGIQMLVKRKLIEPTSPFVSSTLQLLDSFIQSGQPNFNAAAINTAAAQPGVEQEIAAALKISLEQ